MLKKISGKSYLEEINIEIKSVFIIKTPFMDVDNQYTSVSVDESARDPLITSVNDLEYINAICDSKCETVNYIYIYNTDTRLSIPELRIWHCKDIKKQTSVYNEVCTYGKLEFSYEIPNTNIKTAEDFIEYTLSRFQVNKYLFKIEVEEAVLALLILIKKIKTLRIENGDKRIKQLDKLTLCVNKFASFCEDRCLEENNDGFLDNYVAGYFSEKLCKNETEPVKLKTTMTSYDEEISLANMLKQYYDCDVIKSKSPPYTLYCGSDIGKILELSNVRSVLQHYNKVYVSKSTKGGEHNAAYINHDSLMKVITKSRKPRAIELSRRLNLDLRTKYYVSIETDVIKCIMKTFQGNDMKTQFYVDNYHIDLYFENVKLAIECDESHHNSSSNKIKDRERQDHISQKLSCKFIRFNPNDKNFNLFTLLNEIYVYISGFQSRPLENEFVQLS